MNAPLTDRTLRALHQAHGLLVRQSAPVLTIDQLARRVGLCATALTRGFKQYSRPVASGIVEGVRYG